MKIPPLYFITDSRLTRKNTLLDTVAALSGGAKIVQYREKEKNTEEMIEEAREIKRLCASRKALFIVNDSVDVAFASGADGVHLGQDDAPVEAARKILGKNAVIGVTVHDAKEAVAAEKAGADYVGVSPIFATNTKPDAGKPAGLTLISEVKAKVKIPCVAIGGINEDNMSEVYAAGADSLAMVSAIVAQDDVKQTVERILAKIGGGCR